MAHVVKCVYCGQSFDRDKFPFELVTAKRYAHKACAELANANRTKEEKDKEILYKYICELFKEDYVNPRIQKQIAQYIKDYNYSYSGIYQTLKYWYEIKHNDISKANGGIGIVPCVYKTAYNYNYAIWLAKQANESKAVEDYKPTVREIRIRRPERKIKKRRRFAFLDEEENK